MFSVIFLKHKLNSTTLAILSLLHVFFHCFTIAF